MKIEIEITFGIYSDKVYLKKANSVHESVFFTTVLVDLIQVIAN